MVECLIIYTNHNECKYLIPDRNKPTIPLPFEGCGILEISHQIILR